MKYHLLALMFGSLLTYGRENASVAKPTNPYHLVDKVKVKLIREEQYYVCVELNFVSDWDLSSTHWSMEIETTNLLRITSLTDCEDLDLQDVSCVAPYYRGVVEPGKSLMMNLCGDKLESVTFADVSIAGKLLLYFGTENPPLPSRFVPPVQGLLFDETNHCFPDLSSVSGWDIVLRSLGPLTESRINGRVAVQENADINNLWDKVGSTNCPKCSGTLTNAVAESALVVGGSINNWVTGYGSCAGLIQGSSNLTIADSVLNTAPAGCPKLFGVDANVLPWDQMFYDLREASAKLARLDANGLVGFTRTDGFRIHFVFNKDAGSKLQAVFNVPSTLFSKDGTRFSLHNLEYLTTNPPEFVVINILGKSAEINFANGDLFLNYGVRIIFNFPEATSVTIDNSVLYGTILAPYAVVSVLAGSALSGSIFAQNLQGWHSSFSPRPWVGIAKSGLCSACKTGFYGSKCSLCPCDFNEDCNDGVLGDGTCKCKSTWNDLCTECDPSRFGSNCESVCPSTCITNGICFDGLLGNGTCQCSEDYSGEACDKCKVGYGNYPSCDICDTAHYGALCEKPCNSSCVLHGVCNSGFEGNGSCSNCSKGFTGEQCESCLEGYFGADCKSECSELCQLHGHCDQGPYGTGVCVCEEGFKGENCDKCELSGKYGKSCEFTCSASCVTNGFCDDGVFGTGQCRCKSGFTGAQCAEKTTSDSSIASLAKIAVILVALVTYMQM